MTDQTEVTNGSNGIDSGAAATAVKRAIMKKGYKIPGTGFAEVRPLVQALSELNGPYSRNLVFDQANAAATGGSADTKWAAMGYFGFYRKVSGGEYEISERGQDVISGDDARELHAKQHALVACTAYRAVLKQFETRPVNETALAGVLREDFAVPDTKVKSAMALLITLATESGFIVDGTFKAAPIEQAFEAVPEEKGLSGAGPTGPAARRKPAARPAPAPVMQPPPVASTVPPAVEKVEVGKTGPFGVTMEIRVDAEHHTPEQIGQIVREVRQALTGD